MKPEKQYKLYGEVKTRSWEVEKAVIGWIWFFVVCALLFLVYLAPVPAYESLDGYRLYHWGEFYLSSTFLKMTRMMVSWVKMKS